jgi:eukaryotic-like serine/threonine-protein kinase
MEESPRTCSRCGESYAADVIFCPKDGTPLGGKKTDVLDDPYIDLQVAGQFRIQQLIGIGAMGRVYRAHQKGIDRPVAIKILHRDLLRNPTVMTRFVREAKVASRLVHPNVIQVLMAGELDRVSADIGGEAYLVMEFLDGISLRSALAAAGTAMPLPRALHIILQVCDAVGEAHAQSIVHRDLKPENVMLVRRGDDADFVKVLDFGVARIDWADTSVATQAGVIFGTARYISPEGAQGLPVSSPSDVYSIAVMLFQCLSGETPFDADNPVGILIKHTSQPAPDVRSIARSSYVPEPLARVIAANLAKDPAERCRDARELGRAVVDAARSSGLSPDELVMRSTLLGGARSALSLASMERTKSLDLTPELSAKMAGKSSPSGTEVVEGEPEAKPGPAGQPAGATEQPHSRPGPSEPERPSRPSLVDPTLHDEPASELLSSPRGSVPPSIPPGGTAPGTPAPVSIPPRPSFPDELYDPPEPASPQLPRWMFAAACFIVGVGITVLGAKAIGVFDRTGSAESEATAAWYAERANRAIAENAWDEPPGENVRDITDAALRRWPNAHPILEVRQNAARILIRRARQERDLDSAEALRWAKLASELDPSSSDAQTLANQLAAADRDPEASSVEGDSATQARPPRPKKTAAGLSGTRRKPEPKPQPAPEPPAKPADAGTAAPAPGGRWL